MNGHSVWTPPGPWTPFERALRLTPAGHHERPDALARFGQAAFQSGRLSEAAEALEEAIGTFRERGDILAATRAMSSLHPVLQGLSDARGVDVSQQALALLEPLPPGPELVQALVDVADYSIFSGRSEEGLALVERALELSAGLGLARPTGVLGSRGMARCTLGDEGGLEDLREGLGLAIRSGQGLEAGITYNNLGVGLLEFQGPRAALECFREGKAFAKARGLHQVVLLIESSTLSALLGAGELEEVLTSASEIAKRARAAGHALALIEIRGAQALALVLRGRAHDAAELLDGLESGGLASGRIDVAAQDLGRAAVCRTALGDTERAGMLLERIEATPDVGDAYEFAPNVPALVRAAITIGDATLAERLVGHLRPRHPCADHALVAANAALAEARDDLETAAERYAEAASRWETFGMVPEEGFALLGRGRCLLAMSRPGESSEILGQALEIFARCGMRPALEETDALFAKAAALGV